MISADRFRAIVAVAAQELLALGVLGAGIVLFLARLSKVGGADTLFYDSDSLTMPLLTRALSAPEGMGWTSGPFLGLFPELPTYLLADLFTSTTKSALVVCGFLNIAFLYLAMRLLANVCGMTFPVARRAATLGTLLITLGMAAETFRSSEWRLGWMLFSSTYYVGISTLGVVTLALVTRILRGHRSARGDRVALPPVSLSGTLLLVALFTTVSNPMFSVIVAVPCCAAIVVFRFARQCSSPAAGVAFGSLLIGTVLGYLFQPMLHMVNGSVDGYIHSDRIGRTARMVATMITSLLKDPFGAIELVILVALVLFALFKTSRIVFARKLGNFVSLGDSSARAFVSMFVAAWIVLAPFALIITGPGVTRYFGTFAVFPLCVVVANFPLLAQRFSSAIRKITMLVVAALSAAVMGLLPAAQAAIAVAPPPEIACVSATVPKGSSGVGEFWTARPIDLFNTAGLRVLQSNSTLGIFDWISNPAEFKNRDLTFVLTSWDSGYTPINAASVAPLGAPSRVTKCGRLDVYEYRPGTPAHTKLNQRFNYPG